MKRSGRFGASVVIALTTFAGAALAYSGGVSGKSGKQGTYCISCHNGGPIPFVKLDGPASLDAGASAVYTFTIITTNLGTGMNAAVSDGKLTDDDGGTTRIEPYTDESSENPITTDEITHNQVLRPTDAGPNDSGAEGGAAVYRFRLTAPELGGPISLYAAGNAVNLNDDTDGDNAAKDKLDIMIYGPPRPPDASAPAPPATGPVITPFPDAGTTPPASTSNAAPASSDSGCAMGAGGGSSRPAGALFGGLVGLAAILRGRRRQPLK